MDGTQRLFYTPHLISQDGNPVNAHESLTSLLYNFVINIVAVTVHFLVIAISNKLFLSQPMVFTLCTPSSPLQLFPEGRGGGSERAVPGFCGNMKLQKIIPKPQHTHMKKHGCCKAPF